MASVLDNILRRSKGSTTIFGVDIDYAWGENKKINAWADAIINHADYLEIQHRIIKEKQPDGRLRIYLKDEVEV